MKFSPSYLRAQRTSTGDNIFGVIVYAREPFEDMWETLWYRKTNLTLRQADKLVEAILDAGSINTEHWTWHPSPCSYYGFMQLKPKGK